MFPLRVPPKNYRNHQNKNRRLNSIFDGTILPNLDTWRGKASRKGINDLAERWKIKPLGLWVGKTS